MKKSMFSGSRIVAILKEREAGLSVVQPTRKHGISAANYCRWKSKYAGAGIPELKRLRELEAGNATLRRMYADRALESAATLDVLRRIPTPSAKGAAIRFMTEEHGLPIIRACQAARLSLAARYKPGTDERRGTPKSSRHGGRSWSRTCTVPSVVVATLAFVATAALADDVVPDAEAEPKPAWEFAVTAYPTAVRNGENYTSAIATVDRGALHLEARYNYESIGARSAFVGWNFSGGETVTWELTPILGGAWGTTRAFVPGFEASLAWRRLDFYIEAEYVRDSGERSDSYLYAWSELGFQPVEWLRLGIAGQRTRLYGGERDIQRGPFVQATLGAFTLGGYWFNPGSSDQIFVGMISAAF